MVTFENLEALAEEIEEQEGVTELEALRRAGELLPKLHIFAEEWDGRAGREAGGVSPRPCNASRD